MFPFSFWSVDQQAASPMWTQLNATFLAIIGWSWLIYVMSALIILACGYFAYCERRRQLESTRRRQRALERPPQKRRPNAAYRDHQINRHIILSVAKYMKGIRNPEGMRPFIEQID